jgi:predicted ATP-grasp superfamily ATP-dependent carboligase
MREEQLHTALQKNKRLERQISLQANHKPSGSMSRAISPGKDEFEEIRFTRKISKPIRGGGGNFSNFQRNNQIFSNNNDYLFRRKSVEKISNQGGLKSMIKDIFGGLLG